MPNQYTDPKYYRLQWLIDSLKTESDACLLWPFTKTKRGYGSVNYQGRRMLVHRAVMMLTNPNFDESLDVLHHCDNPSCFRPKHLFQGTAADNVADMMAKGRQYCGERHYLAKLTDQKVRDARMRWVAGETQASIAASYGVSPSKITDAINRKTWKHVK